MSQAKQLLAVLPGIARPIQPKSEYKSWREADSYRASGPEFVRCTEMRRGRFFAHAYPDGSWICGLVGGSDDMVAQGLASTQEQATLASERMLHSLIVRETWGQ